MRLICSEVLASCLLLFSLPALRGQTVEEYRRFAAVRDGDPRRGQLLFANEQRAACAKCHSIDGSASKAGPDLNSIGDKFARRDLIEAVLRPSDNIAIGYGTTVLELRSGEEVQGILKQATPDFFEVMGADGRAVRVQSAEVKAQRGSNISLMPEGLQAGLTLQEFADLIEFLTSLRQPANALASNQGTPSEIPQLAKPVALVPLFREDQKFPNAFVVAPGDVRYGLTWFAQIPSLSNSFLVVHQPGKIWLMERTGAGFERSLFGDFSSELFNQRGPNGLLCLAFHPHFLENRKYYLKHQVFEEGKIATVLVEKKAAPDFRRDSGEPSRRLLKIVSTTQDHSGGCIQFGPDGYLYLGMGDTGPQQDPQGHGQDLQTLLAKIVRIDVDQSGDGRPYGIPRDNPFLGRHDVLPEIWAYGFREPWRFSFDSATGDLWVGDVGQDRVEEVAIVHKGENHGWNVFEGFEPFSNRYRREGERYVAPIFAYRRKYGNSITGGYVYRGDKRSSFYGVYICGDYTSKRIWGVRQENRKLKAVWQIGVSPQGISSFATDQSGNIYVVGYEGMIYKLDLTTAEFPKD